MSILNAPVTPDGDSVVVHLGNFVALNNLNFKSGRRQNICTTEAIERTTIGWVIEHTTIGWVQCLVIVN